MTAFEVVPEVVFEVVFVAEFALGPEPAVGKERLLVWQQEAE